jgi:hypothetical protein
VKRYEAAQRATTTAMTKIIKRPPMVVYVQMDGRGEEEKSKKFE